MATSVAQQVYQCDQCGNPDIMSVPLLYQQGTRTFSGLFGRRISQSVAVQRLAPPRPHRYLLRAFIWGFGVTVSFLWGSTALSALSQGGAHPTSLLEVTGIFLLLCLGTVIGLLRSMREIYRYNHEIYHKLESEWSHSFVCRRCGKLQLVS